MALTKTSCYPCKEKKTHNLSSDFYPSKAIGHGILNENLKLIKL